MAQITGLSLEEFLALPFEELAALTGAEIWHSSRPWNSHLISNSREFAAYVNSLAEQIDQLAERKRRPKNADQAFRAAIAALLLDVFSAAKADPDLQIGINLNANVYGAAQRTRYSNSQLTYRQLKAAFDGLLQLDCIQIVKRGWYDKSGAGANTKVRASQALLEALSAIRLTDREITRSPAAEVIFLRAPKRNNRVGALIDYADTQETDRMRAVTRYINSVLEKHHIGLMISDDELQGLQHRTREKRDYFALEFSRRSLFRVFNDGEFIKGGRFYGGWWQEVPREYRAKITIDGESTIEADYSAIHPRLLYAREGIDCDGDPYDVGLDPRHRECVKRALNALINAGPGGISQPSSYDPEDVGLTHRDLLERVGQHHQRISRYFYTGIGLELQFMDSCIAERIMLRFADRGIACLPIHDSFLVQQKCERDLIEVMFSAYPQVTGRELMGDNPERLIRIKGEQKP